MCGCPSATRPLHEALSVVNCRGALLAVGPAVEKIAAVLRSAVPQHAQRHREQRDGPRHHITIIPKMEMPAGDHWKGCAEQALTDLAASVILPLGVGRAGRSYYVVVLWPAAQEYRVQVGLPETDLHLTLGFEEHDSHGVSKGPLTLLPADCQPARPRDWRRWADATLVARAIVQQRRDASTEAALRWLCAEAYDHGAGVAEGALRCILGGLLGSVGRLDEAATEAEAARACASSLPQAWLLCASCACERRDWDRADSAMRTAARLLFASEASPSCTPPPSDTARAALTLASHPAVQVGTFLASSGDGQGSRAELVRLKSLDRERRARHGELLESCLP